MNILYIILEKIIRRPIDSRPPESGWWIEFRLTSYLLTFTSSLRILLDKLDQTKGE